MDTIVHQAMAKWPNVPDCYGWLGLDARGDWYLRDAAAQSAGAFASSLPGAKGDRLLHEGLIGFIQRNYMADAAGRWYFQNGPQRVYVELEHTPWVWRVNDDGTASHPVHPIVSVLQALLDEQGWLYLVTEQGFGLVHTHDTGRAADALDRGDWALEEVIRSQLPARFAYQRSPQAGQVAT